MRLSKRIGGLALAALLMGASFPPPAAAQDGASSGPETPGIASGVAQPDRATLDGLVRDLGLSLLSRSGGTTLRVPLAPQSWSLAGLQPYAALSPLAIRPGVEGVTGAAAPPDRQFDELSRGLGLGAGVTLRLSERLDMYGQYLFRAVPGAGSSSIAPTLRPDAESPGLKGGLSVHF